MDRHPSRSASDQQSGGASGGEPSGPRGQQAASQPQIFQMGIAHEEGQLHGWHAPSAAAGLHAYPNPYAAWPPDPRIAPYVGYPMAGAYGGFHGNHAALHPHSRSSQDSSLSGGAGPSGAFTSPPTSSTQRSSPASMDPTIPTPASQPSRTQSSQHAPSPASSSLQAQQQPPHDRSPHASIDPHQQQSQMQAHPGYGGAHNPAFYDALQRMSNLNFGVPPPYAYMYPYGSGPSGSDASAGHDGVNAAAGASVYLNEEMIAQHQSALAANAASAAAAAAAAASRGGMMQGQSGESYDSNAAAAAAAAAGAAAAAAAFYPYNPYGPPPGAGPGGYDGGYPGSLNPSAAAAAYAAAVAAAGVPPFMPGGPYGMQGPGPYGYAGLPHAGYGGHRHPSGRGQPGGRGRGMSTSSRSNTGTSQTRGEVASPRLRRRQDSTASLGEANSPLATPVASTGLAAPLTKQALSGSQGDYESFPSATGHRQSGSIRGQEPIDQALRTEHVMWVGNVPSDATVPELWAFFSVLRITPNGDVSPGANSGDAGPAIPAIPAEHIEAVPGATAVDTNAAAATHGILSIFVIARSNCAFVNYVSAHALSQAVSSFTGKSLRPHDPHCPRLVCRVRKKDEEVQAGVAGQRGKGHHVAYVKEHERQRRQEHSNHTHDPSSSTATLSHSHGSSSRGAPSGLTDEPESIRPPERPPLKANANDVSSGSLSGSSGSGGVSYTSTNSSLLRHPAFKERFFILKSHSTEELASSVRKGTWATQPHNEDVLDQAFRNSQNVYLLFSANQSGEWFGVARMAGPIKPAKAPSPHAEPSPSFARRQVQRPATILEETSAAGTASEVAQRATSLLASPSPLEDETRQLRLTPSRQTDFDFTSGGDHPTPSKEDWVASEVIRRDMIATPTQEGSSISSVSVAPSDSVSYSSSSKDMHQLAVRALIHNLRLDERESSLKAAELEQSLRPGEDRQATRSGETLGKPFKVEWIHIKPVPFHATRKLRNPWRDNRQVKVSRDGTELEPGVGREMLDMFRAYDAELNKQPGKDSDPDQETPSDD